MTTIFDIGMYDCADTAYYLETGNRVVAVEANRAFVERAQQRFAPQIAAGQLTVVNAAISENGEPVELMLSGDDLGSSSLFGERVAGRQPIGSITAPGLRVQELFDRYGVPDYLKVDIEGADRLCILNLAADRRPRFLSFEVGPDVEELVEHARAIGYDRFKIINQISFRELANESNLRDRVALRLAERLGLREPLMVKRAGRFFVSGRSSGPLPWISDGRWYSFEETIARWRGSRSGASPSAWYDIHATKA